MTVRNQNLNELTEFGVRICLNRRSRGRRREFKNLMWRQIEPNGEVVEARDAP
jgi:hypothetical protein